MFWKSLLTTALVSMTLLSACATDTPVAASKLHGDDEVFAFTVQVQNTSNSTAIASPLAPMAWAVYGSDQGLFSVGQKASAGLQTLAEDGGPDGLLAEITAMAKGHIDGPIAPGETKSFTFEAKPGQFLSFASMWVQSNDVIVAPQGGRLALFDGRNEPFTGNATLVFYDAGTEVNQMPGSGADQAPRQAGPNTGAAEDVNIQVLGERNDGFTYPAVGESVRVTISADHDHDHEGEKAKGEDHEGEDHDHDEDKK